jgi:hypothetical protein
LGRELRELFVFVEVPCSLHSSSLGLQRTRV